MSARFDHVILLVHVGNQVNDFNEFLVLLDCWLVIL